MRQLANSFTHNWVVLLGACVLLLDVVRGLLTGGATVAYRRVQRRDDPALYWAMICFSAVLGLGGLYVFFLA